MVTIIKNVACFSPKYLGVKDICVMENKIASITDPGKLDLKGSGIRTLEAEGLLAFPGMIDGHVHIIGGGGEEGFESQIGEIDGTEILKAGITTVVGLLGADGLTKSLYSLLAKAKALESEGISTFIYSGSYALPPVTFTGDIAKDMVLIDKVVGAGEIAISDHRSSHPDIQELLALSSKVHMGSLIGGKAGLLHLHLGDGKTGLSLLHQLLEHSDLPMELFLPTHINRNPVLFEQGIAYVRQGGNIDLTSGEEQGLSIPEAIQKLIQEEINLQQVTVSSDANGSIPDGGVGKIRTLFDDVIRCITETRLSPELVFPLVTAYPARRLKQYPQKGILAAGSDADILLLNANYEIETLFAMGELKIHNKSFLGKEGNNWNMQQDV